MLSPSSYFLQQELLRRGFSVTTFDDPYLLLIEKNGKQRFTHASKTTASSAQFFVCKDKFLTKQVLQGFGFPVARGVKITKDEIAKTSELTFPVVIKPLLLSGGEDIVVGVRTPQEIESYFDTHPYTELLIEEMLTGVDTRMLIIRGTFFAACRREPASVVGDGTHTLAELVEQENVKRQEIIRKEQQQGTFETNTVPILFDEQAEKVIREQGKEASYVPAAGERFFVRSNANVSTGGRAIDVTDEVGQPIRELCEAIARKLGMTTLGIDIMTDDLRAPLSLEHGYGIVEINASPMLVLHSLVHEGQRRDPVPLLVDEIEEQFARLA